VQANAETAVRASTDEGVIEFSSMMSGCASRALRPTYIASFFYAKPYRYDNTPLPEDMADAYNLSMARSGRSTARNSLPSSLDK
jgi:hypothetical protein